MPRKILFIFVLLYCSFGQMQTTLAQVEQPWTNVGIYGGQVCDIAIDPTNPQNIFVGTYLGQGLYRSMDGGASWQGVDMGLSGYNIETFMGHAVFAVAMAPNAPNIIWVGHNTWLAKSSDGGRTWEAIYWSNNSENYFHCIAIHPQNPDVVYVGVGGNNASGAVFKTEDGGGTFTKMNLGNDLDFRVEDLAFDPFNPQILWAVTNSNGYKNNWIGTIYRSSDGGTTFAPIIANPVISPCSIYAVTPHPAQVDVVFVGCGYGVIRIQFDGTRWQANNPIPASSMARAIEFAPSDPNLVYACWNRPTAWNGDGLPKLSISEDGGATWQAPITLDARQTTEIAEISVHPTDANSLCLGDLSLGIIGSTDKGASWHDLNDGIDAVTVYDMDADPRDHAHLLAGSSCGVYERFASTPWNLLRRGIYKSVCFDPGSGTTYFAGKEGYVDKTIDGGLTWSSSNQLGEGEAFWNQRVSHIDVDQTNSANVFIATRNTAGGQVMRSTDGGATFSSVLQGVNQAGEPYDMNTVLVDPADSRHIVAGGGNFYSPYRLGDLWQSHDGGETWQRTGLTNTIVNALLIDPRNTDTWYAGCGHSYNYGHYGAVDEPIRKSTDGGETWTVGATGMPNSRVALFDLWGLDANRIVAVATRGLALIYNGTAVDIEDTGDTGSDRMLLGVFGTAQDDIFAVGYNGSIVHYDGSAWQAMSSGTSAQLEGVWAAAANNVFAVGTDGTLVHYDGTGWFPMNSSVNENLKAVFGLSADNIFAVGDSGTILHYDGIGWGSMNSGTSQTLSDLWAAGSDEVFAVGENGTILHFDGSAWQAMASNTTGQLSSVWGSSADDVYAVSHEGHLLHYDGRQWTQVYHDPQHRYESVWGTTPDQLFIGAFDGGLWRYDGRAFTTLREPGNDFRSVTDLAFHRQNPDIIYASTLKAGVFVSPNQTGKWLNLDNPSFEVNAIATGSLYAGTSQGIYQLTGTGVLAGQVRIAGTHLSLDGATVGTALGNRCRSINGDYMMVVPAGIFDVFAVVDNYKMAADSGITVLGGDVTWHHFSVSRNGPLIPENINGSNSTKSGGAGYCFIGTLPRIRFDFFWHHGGFLILLMAPAAIFIDRTRLPRASKAPVIKKLKKVIGRCLAGLLVLQWSGWILVHPAQCDTTLFQQVGIASPPVPVGSGARALGMGGAFISVADDATAASWNPAGLVQLEKPELSIVGSYTHRSYDFSSDTHPETESSGCDEDIYPNYFSATFPFHWHKSMVVSLNYQRLYDFNRSFSHSLDYSSSGLDLTQQIQFEQSGQISAVGLAGAMELTPHLSLGVTLNVWTDELGWDNGWTERYQVRSYGTQNGVPVTTDTRIKEDYEQFRGINANIGLLWETGQWGTIGVVLKTPFTAELVHRFRYDEISMYGAPLNSTTVTGPLYVEEQVKLHMPLSYGIGWSKRFTDAWTVAIDIHRTEWDDYILTDSQGNKFSPIDGSPKGQSDVAPTTHVHIGSEYAFVLPEIMAVIPVRAGLFYDPEPSADRGQNFYGLAIGSGFSQSRCSIDLAYQLRWGPDIETDYLIAGSKSDIIQHLLLASIIFYF